MHAIRASARFNRAIHSTAELLAKLRIDSIFVGSVARAAWLGDAIEHGSIDVLALMTHQQKNQLAMMASNRGYRVEREEIEQSEELDLVPLNFVDAEGDVRVHVLLASNALYGRMVASSQLTARSSQLSGAGELSALSSQLSGADELSALSSQLSGADELSAFSSQLSGVKPTDAASSPASCELRAESSTASCELRAASSFKVPRAEDLALMLHARRGS